MSLGLSNDDAALIDSYFLPGGILDPDEDEGDEKPLTTRIPPSWPLVMSRVPSNPWCNEDATPSSGNLDGNPSPTPEVLGLTVQDTGRLHASHHTKGLTGNPLHLKPPPGYQNHPETYFHFPITHPPASHLIHNTHSQSDCQHNPAESQRSRLNPSSPGPIDLPLLAFQDRTIRRPCRQIVETAFPPPQHLQNTPYNHNREPQGLGISRSYSEKQSREQSDAFGEDTGIDHDSGQSAIRSHDDSLGELLKVASSERATSMEGSDFQINEEDVEDINDEEQHDDYGDEDEEDEDGQADDIEESSDEELPFPMEEVAYVGNSKNPDSAMSSLSTSSSSSLEAHNSHLGFEDNEYDQALNDDDPMDENRPLADPDSAVAVILDFSDTVGGNNTIDQHISNEYECPPSDMEKHSNVQYDSVSTAMPHIAVSYDALPVAISEAESIHSSQSSSKNEQLQETTANFSSRFKVWSNNFQKHMAWVDDLHQAVVRVVASTWAVLRLFTSWGMKLLLITSLLLFQGWKYAFVQLIEEPQVTLAYAIFYLMPSFCSLLRELFLMPHWMPHFLTTLAVWSLCTQISAGPLSFDTYTVAGYLRHIINSHDFSSPVAHSRDERACLTILRVLRVVLPFFFFADGFSTEFGTIMGVSGSSRLTTAFMMSLVRKSLVSSPVGWVSWAIQVLLATHHHSSPLVDAFVLMSGLSSIRLIRYLDALRASNKRRQGKEH